MLSVYQTYFCFASSSVSFFCQQIFPVANVLTPLYVSEFTL